MVGISVGSEDLYRNSPDGIEAESGFGANPDQLVSYIGQVRELIEGTSLADASLGHVDTVSRMSGYQRKHRVGSVEGVFLRSSASLSAWYRSTRHG